MTTGNLYKTVTNTTYISYGAETSPSTYSDSKFNSYLKEKGIKKDKYYLSVGRFVPENNYETIIREFMKTNINKDYVIITNYDEESLSKFETLTNFSKDKRIKFIGIEYNNSLLQKIRENAYGSIHGHEVGGTNPSLLEALASSKLNLVYDCAFNKEVAQDSSLYWTKQKNNLSELLKSCEKINRKAYTQKSKKIIEKSYSWDFISKQYKQLFTRI